MKQKQKQKKNRLWFEKGGSEGYFHNSIYTTDSAEVEKQASPTQKAGTHWVAKAGPSKHVKGHGHICIFRCMVPLHENLTAYFWHTTT